MSKRKHDEQSEEKDDHNGDAKRGRSAETHDVSEAAAAAGSAAAPNSAAAAAAAPADPYAAEVAHIRRTHLRHVHTESLMSRMLDGGQATLRERVDAYTGEMKKDAKRAESLLDVNYQDDEEKTLLMHVRRHGKLKIVIRARGECGQLLTARPPNLTALTRRRLSLLFPLSVPVCQVIKLFGALCAQRRHPSLTSCP